MSNLHVERMWPRDDVRDSLVEAAEIVTELQTEYQLSGELVVPAFQLAVQLVTQRAVRQQVGGVHLPPGPLQ